jgi:hypothetical protein
MTELRLTMPVRTSRRRLSLHERVNAYLRAFPECPNAVWVAGHRDRWLYGVWQIGGLYKNLSRYYGAYPRTYLERVAALFPEIAPQDILHAFSGSLPKGTYTRLDINPELEPELVGSVYDVAQLTRKRFHLVIADPSYSPADAARYGTASIDTTKATAALAQVTKPGGFLVWLDTKWPMHRKREWHYFGQIEVVRSTGHRLRGVSIFERKRG